MPRDRSEAEEDFRDLPSEEEFLLPDPQPGERVEARFQVVVGTELYSTSNVSRVGLFVEGLTSLPSDPLLMVEIEFPTFGSYRLSCVVVHVVDEERAIREELVPGTGLLVVSADEPYYDLMNFCIKAAKHERQKKRDLDPAISDRLPELGNDLRWSLAWGAESGSLVGGGGTSHSKLSPCQTGNTGFRLVADETKIHR